MWKFSGLFRCENFQAYLSVKISGLKFSGVKFFNPPNLAQFQPNLHVKILAHVKISGLKQVWFTCENRCDRFGTGMSMCFIRTFGIGGIPSKSAKFGIKFWVLCEATRGYIMLMNIYRGWHFDPVRRVELQGTEVVCDLLSAADLMHTCKWHHVFCDSFFSSMYLARRLLKQRTYLTG